MNFEWHEDKNAENSAKHGLSFYEAQEAFFDSQRVIRKTRNTRRLKKGIFV